MQQSSVRHTVTFIWGLAVKAVVSGYLHGRRCQAAQLKGRTPSKVELRVKGVSQGRSTKHSYVVIFIIFSSYARGSTFVCVSRIRPLPRCSDLGYRTPSKVSMFELSSTLHLSLPFFCFFKNNILNVFAVNYVVGCWARMRILWFYCGSGSFCGEGNILRCWLFDLCVVMCLYVLLSVCVCVRVSCEAR